MNDNEIIELYLSRNEEAITQSASKYGSRLRHIANNILNDGESTKECDYCPLRVKQITRQR